MNLLRNYLSEAAYQSLQAEKARRLIASAKPAIEWQSLIRLRPYTTPDGREHTKQREFVECDAKRTIIKAGRRGGKTVGIARKALEAFKAGKRVLYTAPTQDQVKTFWFEVKLACADAIKAGYLRKNETEYTIEVRDTKNRIRAKTAWNAETLRGDYADLLIFDEFQLTSEDAWEVVGLPMLIDNDGDAVFIYTPLSLATKTHTKAKDKRYTVKMYKAAEVDTTGDWKTFHFTSYDNPHNKPGGVEKIAGGMTAAARKQEIMAEDSDEIPDALWKQSDIDKCRVSVAPELRRIVIGVDPPGGATECGIVCAGLAYNGDVYVLDDISLRATPEKWANAVIKLYTDWRADRVLGEKNYGGDMVENTIRMADGGRDVSFSSVLATRGKAVRAEPVAALYERGKVHHVGMFEQLEEEQTGWVPNAGMPSPNRMDALVWCITELVPAIGGLGLPIFME